MFYRYFPFWHTFFETLGWKVMVSDGVRQKEKIIYFEDSCLPMKLLVTHAIQLKDKVDHLFIPRFVSLHRTYIMCPKFRGAPDIVRLAIERKVSIIDETIDLRKGGVSLRQSFLKIGERLGATKQEGKKAFLEAEKSFSQFRKEWMDRINRLPTEQLFEMDIPTPALRRVQGPALNLTWFRAPPRPSKLEGKRLGFHCVLPSSVTPIISSTPTSTKISSL